MLHEKLVDIHVYYMSYKHQWLLYFLCLVHHKYSMSIKEKILNMIRSIQINCVTDSWVTTIGFCSSAYIRTSFKTLTMYVCRRSPVDTWDSCNTSPTLMQYKY